MRLIKVPHTGGLIDYKGEPISDFGEILESFRDKEAGTGYLVVSYTGLSGIDVWEDAVLTPIYRTRVTQGELIVLLEMECLCKIDEAAYPTGDAIRDGQAFYFFERAKFPTSQDGLFELTDEIMTQAFTYFVSKGYMTDADKERVTKGILIS